MGEYLAQLLEVRGGISPTSSPLLWDQEQQDPQSSLGQVGTQPGLGGHGYLAET